MPVPDNVTCCGLVVALSKIMSVAGCAPAELGENEMPSLQFALAATVMGTGPQVPVPLNAYSGSEGVAPPITSAFALPVFVTVTVLSAV